MSHYTLDWFHTCFKTYHAKRSPKRQINAIFVLSSGNQVYSRNRKFYLKLSIFVIFISALKYLYIFISALGLVILVLEVKLSQNEIKYLSIRCINIIVVIIILFHFKFV